MADFSQQITNFQSNGAYNYQFDEVGNQILNPSSSVFQQNYLSFPTVTVVYNASKISSFFDATLTEFIPAQPSGSLPSLSQDIIDQINEITQKSQVLQNQLDDMIAQSELDSSAADAQSIKDIVLALRIQLGQGTTSDDFQTEFPYLPIPIDQKETN
jgi:hypothetical protein